MYSHLLEVMITTRWYFKSLGHL